MEEYDKYIFTLVDNAWQKIQIYTEFNWFTHVQVCPKGRGNPSSHIEFKQQVCFSRPDLMSSLDSEGVWKACYQVLLGKNKLRREREEWWQEAAVLACLQLLKCFPLSLLGTICYLGITNGGGCSRVTCLLGEDRERNTTMYPLSEEYKAGLWVKWLLCCKIKILYFLSQPGNSRAGPDSQTHTSNGAHSWEEVFIHFYILVCQLQT